MACLWAFTIGRGVTDETRSKNKRDEKEYCESAINKSRVICKEGTRKEYGKESKGEEITWREIKKQEKLYASIDTTGGVLMNLKCTHEGSIQSYTTVLLILCLLDRASSW